LSAGRAGVRPAQIQFARDVEEEIDSLADRLDLGFAKKMGLPWRFMLIKALEDDQLVGWHMDDAVPGIIREYILPGNGIAVIILAVDLMQGAPGAQVRPSEIRFNDEDISGFLHNAVIDGNAFANRIGIPDKIRLLVGEIITFSFFKKLVDFRKVIMESFQNAFQ